MILIIDDDKAICLSLALLLEKDGFETEAAHTPSEAWAVIGRIVPELILLDMNY